MTPPAAAPRHDGPPLASGLGGDRRLLYVYNDPAFFLSYRLPIAVAAREAGFDVHVAAPPDPGWREVMEAGFPFHPFALDRRGNGPIEEARSIASLGRLYRSLRPDLIEHATIKPVIYGSLAARLAGSPPVLNHITGLGYVFSDRRPSTRVLRRVVEAAYRVAFRLPRLRVVFENEDNLAHFVAHGLVRERDAVLVRGGGTDIERFDAREEPEGVPRILLPSRMLWHKGVADFVGAARLLARRGVRAEFVLAGDTDGGNPGAIPRAQLEEWSGEGIVTWLGHTTDMPATYANSAIVCLPSRYGEGVPRALIEGAATARPLVTTDTPGCRDIVREGENGLRVPPGDQEALADALARLVLDPGLRRRMGERGRDIATAEFSLTSVIRQVLGLYGDLLGRSPADGADDPAARLSRSVGA